MINKKNIIITGGSEGFGFEIAKYLVKNNHNVIICSRNNKKLNTAKIALSKIRISKDQIIFLKQIDISNQNQVKNFVKFCLSKLKKIDVLINNAGTYGSIKPFENTKWKDWVKGIETNLYGSIYTIMFLLPTFKKQKMGKIIQLAGGGASKAMQNFSSYSVSKTAIVRFVESIALELKKYNIDINAISPGALNTNMLDEVLRIDKKIIGENFYQSNLKVKNNKKNLFLKPLELINFLISNKSNGVSGKMISALWDNYKIWPKHIDKINKKELYVLRRETGLKNKFKIGDK